MERPPENPPNGPPDTCWQCGYNLSNLDTGVCPECGVNFATGRDVERLRKRLGGDDIVCRTCGTRRPDPATIKCPTCAMRYAAPVGDPVQRRGASSRSGVHGVTRAPEPVSLPGDTRRAAVPVAAFTVLVLAGLGVAVLLVVLANHFSSVLPGVVVTLMKLAALLLTAGMLGWLIFRLMRRDVESLRGQLEAGPRGWSHRVVDRCPNCGYDKAGLEMHQCPECGLVFPEMQEKPQVGN